MIGLILCVCQGTCPSFKKMDIFEVVNHFRREKKVGFVAIHPQLCATDGDEFWRRFLKGVSGDEIIVAGCDPLMQTKMFKDVFNENNFDTSRVKGVDIRNLDTQQAINAIEAVLQK
ncbi:MAG: heterodisulfide reductase subunit A-like protein [Candidatus Methanomethylicaceae archaeon]